MQGSSSSHASTCSRRRHPAAMPHLIRSKGDLMFRFLFNVVVIFVITLEPLTALARDTRIVLAEDQQPPVAVTLKMRADHIVQTVRITSREKGFAEKLKSLDMAREYLLKRAEEESQIIAVEGSAYLEPGSKSLSKAVTDAEPQVEIRFLLPVVRESDNIFSGGIELAAILENLEPPDKVVFHLSAVRLGVEDPEKMRGKLLEMISSQLKASKERVRATGKVTITGLEGPVKVIQADDVNVELYIDYRVSVETL